MYVLAMCNSAMVLETILAAHRFDVLELSCGSVVILGYTTM